mmetsp:Transcript_72425/g.183294  ORF Transcript_72425/g.183294 Transcript_72425/m.183294 type:complete len:237 (-) Transcript_72425:867-1577(-)
MACLPRAATEKKTPARHSRGPGHGTQDPPECTRGDIAREEPESGGPGGSSAVSLFGFSLGPSLDLHPSIPVRPHRVDNGHHQREGRLEGAEQGHDDEVEESDLRLRDSGPSAVHEETEVHTSVPLHVTLQEKLHLQALHPLHVPAPREGQVPDVGALEGNLQAQDGLLRAARLEAPGPDRGRCLFRRPGGQGRRGRRRGGGCGRGRRNLKGLLEAIQVRSAVGHIRAQHHVHDQAA